jgi:hypothetical protein
LIWSQSSWCLLVRSLRGQLRSLGVRFFCGSLSLAQLIVVACVFLSPFLLDGVCGDLGQRSFAMSVNLSDSFGSYQQSKNKNARYVEGVMPIGNVVEGVPSGEQGQDDLLGFLIAIAASFLCGVQTRKLAKQEGQGGQVYNSPKRREAQGAVEPQSLPPSRTPRRQDDKPTPGREPRKCAGGPEKGKEPSPPVQRWRSLWSPCAAAYPALPRRQAQSAEPK